jgi:hypothetical protein
MILWQVLRGTPDCWDKQAMDICRDFSTISFKSSSISSDTGGRPNDLPLLIVLIVKNLFTIRLMWVNNHLECCSDILLEFIFTNR